MQQDTRFGSWLKQRRSMLNLSQQDLARVVHCSCATIRKIESGTRRPSYEIATLFAKHLDIPRDQYAEFIRFARGKSCSSQDGMLVPPLISPQRSKLAPPLTPCIGRSHQVAALRQRIVRDATRLLTLTGPGGVGKTRLAIEVANSVIDSFADGVVFVGLEFLTDPAQVATAILRELGVVHDGRDRAEVRLHEYCRDKHCLLVLDNFEHLLAAAPLLTELLSACPWLSLLTTSRIALQLRGEHLYSVPPLTLPGLDHAGPLDQLMEYGAIALFIQRAQATQREWTLSGTDMAAVADICRRLDGVPLAIEIAAAQIRLQSPVAISRQLRQVHGLLEMPGFRDAPRRHATVRAAIAWSHQLLDPAAQQLFARLAIFEGGWTRHAMSVVCGQARTSMSPLDADPSPPLLASLLTLVDHHLVRREAGQDGRERFSMLQTIHEYARELLAAGGEMAMMQERHACYFRDLAEYAELLLRGPEQPAGLAYLEPEYANLDAALTWYSADPARTADGLRLTGALGEFWFIRSQLVHGLGWLHTLLNRDGIVPLHVRAKALRYAAVLASAQGDVAHSVQWNRESLTAHEALSDPWGMAYTLAAFGDVLVSQTSERAQGQSLLAESLRLAREINDSWLLTRVLWRVAMDYYYVQRNVPQGQSLFAESLATATAIGDLWGMSHVLPHMATIAWSQGDINNARTLAEEALALARMIGNQRSTATALNTLGMIALHDHEYLRARAYHEESLRVAQAAHLSFQHAGAFYFLGRVALRQHEYENAQSWLLQSIREYHTLNASLQLAGCLVSLALVTHNLGHAEWTVRLLSAVTKLVQDRDLHIPKAHQDDYEQLITSTQHALEGATWDQAWEAGQYLSVEDRSLEACPGDLRTLPQQKCQAQPSLMTAMRGQKGMPT